MVMVCVNIHVRDAILKIMFTVQQRSSRFRKSNAHKNSELRWKHILQNYFRDNLDKDDDDVGIVWSADCAAHFQTLQLDNNSLHSYSHSVEISLEDLFRNARSSEASELRCLAAFVHAAAIQNSVVRISLLPPLKLSNFEAKGIVQGGAVDLVPYHNRGLTGKKYV